MLLTTVESTAASTSDSVVANPANGAAWYALWTHSHCEQIVHDQLEQRGFSSFLPTVDVWSRRRGVRRLVKTPMFPGYLFLRHHMDKESYVQVLRTRGLARVLGERWDRLAEIPDSEMNPVRVAAAAQCRVLPYPYLREGQRARITRGPLTGSKAFWWSRGPIRECSSCPSTCSSAAWPCRSMPRPSRPRSGRSAMMPRCWSRVVLVAAVAVMPATALAQGRPFGRLIISIGQGYDDNLFAAPVSGNLQSDFVTRFGPIVEGGYSSPALSLLAHYGFDAERYIERVELDKNLARQEGRLDLNYRPGPRVALQLDGSYLDTQTPRELNVATLLPAGRARAQRLRGRSGLVYDATAVMKVLG